MLRNVVCGEGLMHSGSIITSLNKLHRPFGLQSAQASG